MARARAAAGRSAGPRPGIAALSRDSVWYRLMKLTNLINRPFFSRYAERYRLTINDARVLVTLASELEAAAHELCDAAGIHPMNVSRSVARLRRQDRIIERSDPCNRRRKILTPTPEGRELAATLRPHVKAISEFLCASLTTSEAEFLGRLLRRLIDRLQAVDLSSPSLLDQDALRRAHAPEDRPRRRRSAARAGGDDAGRVERAS